MVIVEFNASLGTRPLTVAYDDAFRRHDKHPSGFYHGASITAFHALLGKDYALVDVIRGLNLIFVRRALLGDRLVELDPKEAHRPHTKRDRTSGLNGDQQFELIADLEFVDVSSPDMR